MIKNHLKYIYWHIFLTPESWEIINEQLDLLFSSLLYQNCSKITIGIIGKNNDFLKAKKIILEKFNENNSEKICFLHTEKNIAECLTLRRLYEDCSKSKDENYILYFHTKGASKSLGKSQPEYLRCFFWRKTMEFFLIKKWKNCINAMASDPTISVCGIFLRHRRCSCLSQEEAKIFKSGGAVFNTKHKIEWLTRTLRFTGNFWWTKTSYIKSIHKSTYKILLLPKEVISVRTRRTNHERFIMHGTTPHFVFSFCDVRYFCKCSKEDGALPAVKRLFSSVWFNHLSKN